ncbi:MAG: FAD-dependent thymidylate synthase [Candidatus Nanoarchaeia archaeon]
MTLKSINPNINLLGYGPTIEVDGKRITPEQLVAFSSMITYKDKDAIDMIRAVLNSEKDIDKVTLNSLKKSVARGHASLSTSVGLWVLFNGTSKFVDSLFTGAIFSSSLMPSGRRIPIDLENIVAPDSIINADEKTKRIYETAATNNISFYLDLIDKKIPKEEAAKITQYGLTAGGFAFLPLETILADKNEFISQGEWTPKEAFDIIKKIEDKFGEIGVENLYNLRQGAARFTIPHVNIFTNPNNNSHLGDLLNGRECLGGPHIELKYFEEKDNKHFYDELEKLSLLKEEITRSPESVKLRWPELLRKRNEIISAYKNSLMLSSLSNPSWRVWGEIKRHRTLQQQVESVYNAVARSSNHLKPYKQKINQGKLTEWDIYRVNDVFVIPKTFLKEENKDLLIKYTQLFSEALDAYHTLVNRGIPPSDAVSIIPRGIRLIVDKRFDLYNVLEGYIPLRCCDTAEKEMRKTTEIEIEQIESLLPDYLTKHIGPKCASVGHCLEAESCGKVQKYVNFKYDKKVHEYIHS